MVKYILSPENARQAYQYGTADMVLIQELTRVLDQAYPNLISGHLWPAAQWLAVGLAYAKLFGQPQRGADEPES